MNQKKIIGPEYKDEYKRKHRSKFLSEDVETKKRFGVVKVSEFFKPEHKEHFNSLYPYDPEIVDAYKLPEDKKDASKLSKQKAKISIRKNETTKEQPLEEIEKEEELNQEPIIEDNNEEDKNKYESQIKNKFIKIFDPKLQNEEMKEQEVELYIKKGSKTDKIMKEITNDKETVQFFAMYGNTTPTKLIFCEKVKHVEEYIFFSL